jgi:hypothetical protein
VAAAPRHLGIGGFSGAVRTVDQDGMRAVLPLLAVCLCLPACLEMEQAVVLRADGSGTQSLRMAVREAVLLDVQKAAAAAQFGGAANPAAVFDRALVEPELREAGLTLTSHATRTEGGKRTVELAAAFPAFAALQKSPLCGSSAEWVLAAGPRPGTAKLTLYPQGKAAWVDARAKAEAMQGSVDATAADFFRKRQQQLAGLDVRIRFEVPGNVLVWTRNLEKTGDREVTARIEGSRIRTPEDLVRWLAPRFEVVFDASGCTLPLQ